MLTSQQIAQAKATATPTPASPTGGVLPGGAMTPDQAAAWIGGSGAPAPAAPTSTKVMPTQTTGQYAAEQYTQGGQKIQSAITGGAQTIQKGQQTGNPLTIAKGLGETALGTASGMVQGTFAPLTAVIQKATEKVQDNPVVTALADFINKHGGNALDNWATQHPEAATNITDAINVALGVAGGEAAPKGEVSSAGGARIRALNNIPEPAAGPSVTDAFKGMASDVTKGVKKTADIAQNVPQAASDLYKAITAKDPAKVDAYIKAQYQRGVRPTVVGKNTGTQMEGAQSRELQAIDSIVQNKPNLGITDKYGEPTGKVPQTLNEFTQAIGTTKKAIFKKYDALQKSAGEEGAHVDLTPIGGELQAVANNKVLNDLHPELAKYAKTRADTLMDRGAYSTEEAQEAIENLNLSLDAYYKNPSYDTASRASIDALIANKMRGALDDTIEKTGNPGYQDLKNQYGALRSIEKDVVHRAIVDGRKNGVGLSESLINAGSGVELVRGLLTMNATDLAGSAALKGIARYQKYLNDPNTAIKKLFRAAERKASSSTGAGQPPQQPAPGSEPGPLPKGTGPQGPDRGKPGIVGAKDSSPKPTTPSKSVKPSTIPPPPKGEGAAAPDKSALTSDLKPKTLGGRIKQALQNYLDNPQAGLAIEDVSHAGQQFNVGLTSVKGSLTSATDHLVEEGQKLYEKGDFAGAQAKYNEALQEGTKTLSEAFNNTGIKVKAKGVGLGIYQDSLEPNYDLSAVVPKGKEDLFHYILSDVAANKFHQHSMLTYRQVAHDAPLGITDASKGMSNEPSVRITTEKPLTGEDVATIQKAAKEAGVQALSVRNGGRSIDIINITSYNKDYEQFAENAKIFSQNLQRSGISGAFEQSIQEVRFAGRDPSQGHGAVSYDDFRNSFRSQNPGFFNSDQDFTSKVLEKIKNKQSVSPQELDQLTKSQDITPTERGVVLDALTDLKAEGSQRVPTSKFVETVKGKALPIKVTETDSYATYGLDNVGLSTYRATTRIEDGVTHHGAEPKEGAQTLVFSSPVEHGNGGHFNDTSHIGHVRTYIADEPTLRIAGEEKKIGYITELQSDVFQKNSPEDLARKIAVSSPEAKAVLSKYKAEYDRLHESFKELPESVSDDERIHMRNEALDKLLKERDDELSKFSSGTQQQQFLHLAKNGRYQDTLLRGTLQHFKEQGVETVRFVTPSSAAKIEGYINDEDTAPYETADGERVTPQSADFEVGDKISYIGADHTVLESGPHSITIARTDDVHSFLFSDYVDEEVQRGWDERVVYDLKDRTVGKFKITDESSLEKMTPEQAQKLLDKDNTKQPNGFPLNSFDMGDKYLQYRADGLDHEEAKEKMEDIFRESANWSDLEDIYGSDKIFSVSLGKGYDSRVYVVDGETESLGQPSDYSGSMSSDNADAIDPQPGTKDTGGEKKEIENNFDNTQGTVLKGYVDLFEKLQKLAKEQNVPLKYVTGNSDSTWYEFPLTNIKRNLFGS